MTNKILRLLACLLALAMLMTSFSFTAFADADEESSEEAEEAASLVTDAEVLARCQKAAENDNFILYLDPGPGSEDEEFCERIGLYVKESGYIHWSTPVNALADTSTNKNSLRENRLSNLAAKYGNATDLITSSWQYSYRQSTSKGDTKAEVIDGGVKITYDMNSMKATIPCTSFCMTTISRSA